MSVVLSELEFNSQELDDALSWALEQWGEDFELDIKESLTEMVKLYSFEGFDPKWTVAALKTLNGNGVDFTKHMRTLIFIFLERGNKVSKILDNTGSKGKTSLRTLINKYKLKDGGRARHLITLARIAACFPFITCTMSQYITNPTVTPASMKSFLEDEDYDYPRVMMTSAFASCIPKNQNMFPEYLLKAHLLHQYKLSHIIDPKFSRMSQYEKIRTISNFARAAHNSNILEEAKRVKYMFDWKLLLKKEYDEAELAKNESKFTAEKYKELVQELKSKRKQGEKRPSVPAAKITVYSLSVEVEAYARIFISTFEAEEAD